MNVLYKSNVSGIENSISEITKVLIGNGAFIFKPNTIMTQAWWSEANKRLDALSGKLLISPEKLPKKRMSFIVSLF